MRLISGLILFTFFFTSQLKAQLTLEYESVRYIDEGLIQVVANLQNLGSTASAFIPYGTARMNIDPNRNQSRRIDALVRYRYSGQNDFTYDLPNSVNIKTWFGTSIEAEMMQTIRSTGASNYYQWELIFSVPHDALDVSVILFGESEPLPDRPQAIQAEKAGENRSFLTASKADSLFEVGNYSEAYSNYSQAYRQNNSILPEIRDNYVSSSINLGDQALQKNDFSSAERYYSQAKRFSNSSNQSTVEEKIIEYYLANAESEFDEGNFGDAYFLYDEIQSINPNHDYSNSQIRRIESMKRNPTTATFLSVLPGVGQFYNKKYTEGTLFFAAGGLLLTNAIIKFSQEDQTTSGTEVSPQEKAQNSLYLYGALAAWSMYRANNQAKDFNSRLFTPSDGAKGLKIAFVPTHNSINFAMRINF
jgi:tetratricopeptide (TPR) repeat protein